MDEEEEEQLEGSILKPIYAGDMMRCAWRLNPPEATPSSPSKLHTDLVPCTSRLIRLELVTPSFFLDNGKVNDNLIGKVFFIPANFFYAEGDEPSGLKGYTAEAVNIIDKTDRKGLKVAPSSTFAIAITITITITITNMQHHHHHHHHHHNHHHHHHHHHHYHHHHHHHHRNPQP
jgi:hypothetical protein